MYNYCSLIASRWNDKVRGRGCGSIELYKLEIDKVFSREPVEESRNVGRLLVNSNLKTNISNLHRIQQQHKKHDSLSHDSAEIA